MRTRPGLAGETVPLVDTQSLRGDAAEISLDHEESHSMPGRDASRVGFSTQSLHPLFARVIDRHAPASSSRLCGANSLIYSRR